MPARPPSPRTSVAAYVASLPEPLRGDVETLRRVILGAAPGIGEEVKWNAPSFYTGEHFATMRLGGKLPLQLILHLGARKRSIPRGSIEDPGALLRWLGPDSARVDFPAPGAVAARAAAVARLVGQWVVHVPARGGD